MAVADTAYSILDNPTTSGGGGGGTDLNIISSRNTIEVEREGDTVDLNVANEEALRYIIHNFKEFMDAAVDIRDNQYSRGRSCVMQLVKDIDMTSPTATDETTYAGLIDRANKKYNFGGFFKYTTILCDGTRRTLQLTYPDNGNLDTWTFGSEWVRFTNVAVGGGITSYDSFPNHGSPSVSAVSFSRYLLESTGNLNYALDNCEITCCGMPDNTFNPFIKEGSGDNRNAWGIYHSRYVFDNCLFWHGADPHGGIWANCNAPIVITSNYNSTYERSIRIKQLSKSISNTTSETGVPNFQIRTDNASVPTNSWSSHKWQITADGTALVSCQAGNQYLVLKTRLAVNDLYIQGQPTLQPEGATNTYDWVSLVELLQNMGGGVTLENTNDDIATLDRILFQKKDELGGTRILRAIPARLVPAIKPYFGRNVAITDSSATDTDSRILMLANVTTNIESGGVSRHLFSGLAIISPTSDSAVNPQVAKINMLVGSSQIIRLWSDNDDISPCIIYYNNRYYLSVEMKGKAGNLWMLGEYSGISGVDSILYYSSASNKWYSDEARQTEVTFSVYASSQKFPVSVSFGGTSSQVVAGDGTLLNWEDKLGFWKGVTANLPPVGSRESNKLYITTDY